MEIDSQSIDLDSGLTILPNRNWSRFPFIRVGLKNRLETTPTNINKKQDKYMRKISEGTQHNYLASLYTFSACDHDGP